MMNDLNTTPHLTRQRRAPGRQGHSGARDNLTKLALVYCRISTDEQEFNTSLDGQEARCRDLAAREGFTVAHVEREVYSGAYLDERAGMSTIRRLVRTGQYAALFCYTTDRLSREPLHFFTLLNEFVTAGVDLFWVAESVDMSPEGLVIAHMRSMYAKRERERFRERSVNGKHDRLAIHGKIHNSGVDLYGYRRDKALGIRLIFEPEASVIRQIFDMVTNERLGFKTVAARLNAAGIPSPSAGKRVYRDGRPTPRWNTVTIHNIIHDSAYQGEEYGWRGAGRTRDRAQWVKLPDGVTPPIVTAEQWRQAQELVSVRAARMRTRNDSLFFLLRGMVWCGVCGRRYEAIVNRKTWGQERYAAGNVYRCSSRNRGEPCGNKQAQERKLAPWVWERVRELILDPGVTLARAGVSVDGVTARGQRDALAQDRDLAAREAARLEGKQAEMLRRFSSADDSASATPFPWELVEREISRMEAEKRRWLEQARDLDSRMAAQQDMQAEALTLQRKLAEFVPVIDHLTPQEQRDILEILDAHVTIGTINPAQQWSLHVLYPIQLSGGEWAKGVALT